MLEPDTLSFKMFANGHGMRLRRCFKLAANDRVRIPELQHWRCPLCVTTNNSPFSILHFAHFVPTDETLTYLVTTNGTATACNIPMRDKGVPLYITTTSLCTVAVFSILLRLLGAPKSRKKWSQIADDWSMMLNAVSAPCSPWHTVQALTELPRSSSLA